MHVKGTEPLRTSIAQASFPSASTGGLTFYRSSIITSRQESPLPLGNPEQQRGRYKKYLKTGAATYVPST